MNERPDLLNSAQLVRLDELFVSFLGSQRFPLPSDIQGETEFTAKYLFPAMRDWVQTLHHDALHVRGDGDHVRFRFDFIRFRFIQM